MKVYEAVAEALRLERVDTVFGLMGNGNMSLLVSVARRTPVRVVHCRTEGAAVAAADGYSRRSARPGVCSVTTGPGLTQAVTALVAATRHGTPIVILAGDTPINGAFSIQSLDQNPIVAATGALMVAVRQGESVLERVRSAFYLARTRRLPVVLSIPIDIQEQEYGGEVDYEPSTTFLPAASRVQPDLEAVSHAAEAIVCARRPLVIAGAGAVSSDAKESMLRFSARVGALLATTLRAKGYFDGHSYDLGVVGGFASPMARSMMSEADCVIAVGARMGHFTTEGGQLFASAEVIQIDLEPCGYVDGSRVAGRYVVSDARAGVDALEAHLTEIGHRSDGWRTHDVTGILASNENGDAQAYSIGHEEVDPRIAVGEIDHHAPNDVVFVVGAGHFWNFVVDGLRGRPPDRYVFMYDFGAIGRALPAAIGSTYAGDSRVVAIEGDGSLLMNVQELETVRRNRIPVLTIVMNDGAYGAEVHKLNAKGLAGDEAMFGRPDFAAVAEAFGLEGHTVTRAGQIGLMIHDWAGSPRPMLIDVRIAPSVISRIYRRKLV